MPDTDSLRALRTARPSAPADDRAARRLRDVIVTSDPDTASSAAVRLPALRSRGIQLGLGAMALAALLAVSFAITLPVKHGVPGVAPRITNTYVSVATSTAHPTAEHFIWGEPDRSEPGVPLSEALAEVGRHVALPTTAAAGEIDNVVVDETAGDVGRPGMMVFYKSGVRLEVQRWTHDLATEGTLTPLPFADGRPSAFTLKQLAGREVAVREAGTYAMSRSETHEEHACIMWNAAGLGYTLVAPDNGVTVDELVPIMASTH